MASSTRASRMPRAVSCSRTISSRCFSKSSEWRGKPMSSIFRVPGRQRSLRTPAASESSLERPDNPANIARGRRCNLRLFSLGFKHIQILVSRPRIEKYNFVFRREETTCEQFLISNQRRRPLWGRENTFNAGPVSSGCQNFFVGRGDRGATTLFQYLENQVVPIRFRHAQPRRQRASAAPHLRRTLPFFPSLHNRRTSGGLHSNHFRTFRTNPS